MMHRLLCVLATSGGDIFALLFALVAVYASFAAGEPEAYVFPRLASTLMLIFCGANLIRRAAADSAKKAALTPRLLQKIAPGAIVIALYLLLAEDLGFYLSAAATFFTLSLLYGKRKHWLSATVVTVCVIMVLYIMFAVVLKVHTPRGIWL